jgi:hypothetical protein
MIEHEYLKNKAEKNSPKRHDRKPYVKPQLIEYGKIEKLTESGGTKRGDGGGTKGRV